MKTCARCSSEFPSRAWNVMYCAGCRPIVKCEKTRAWTKVNPSARRLQSKKWRDANPDRSRELAQQSYYRNHASRAARRLARKEILRARNRAHRLANLEKDAAKSRRRKAQKRGAYGSHTLAQFRDMCDECSWRCVYCGTGLTAKTVTEDHIVPISKGGSDNIDNIAPACGPCNSSKWSMPVGAFLARRGKAVA